MKKRHALISVTAALVLLIGIGFLIHHLVDPDYSKSNQTERQGGNNSIEKVNFKPSSNPTYKKTCGECHFPYPPELLPSSSWDRILNRLEDHFGEQMAVDPSSKDLIRKYLMESGADRSSSKKSFKIMKSLNGQFPLRITEIPYIQKKHREINPEILNRKTIGSLSNCNACHKTAEQGNFSDDFVTIPN